jgi:hypothetical protein
MPDVRDCTHGKTPDRPSAKSPWSCFTVKAP